MFSAPSLQQRLQTIIRRGWANDETEAMAVLRCFRAEQRGGSAYEAIARPAYRRIPPARRIQLVRTVLHILKGWQ